MPQMMFSFCSTKVSVELVDKTAKAVCVDAGAGPVWLPNLVSKAAGGLLFRLETTQSIIEYQIFGQWQEVKEKLLSLSQGSCLFPCSTVKDGKTARSRKVRIRVMTASRETFRTCVVPASQIVLRDGAAYIPGWCILDKLRDGDSLVSGDSPAITALIELIERAIGAKAAKALAAEEMRRSERDEILRQCEVLMAEIETAQNSLRTRIDNAVAYCKRKFNLEDAVDAGLVADKRSGWPMFSVIAESKPIGNCLPEQRLLYLTGRAAQCRKAEQFFNLAVSLGFKDKTAPSKNGCA